MTGSVEIGALKRLGQLLAGQAKNNVAITGGTISGVTISGSPVTGPVPVVIGASKTVSIPGTYLLDTAAGSVATLPVATGSGSVYRFLVTTTASSNAHKILPNSSSDFLQGIAEGHIAAGTALGFSGNVSASHSIQMPFAGTQPSGGFIGDWFEFRDIASHVWQVTGAYLSGTTSTTPFSTATT